ncbi:MAG: ammonia-dependent NAD(+) synthetase [Promicromonosporaceae bacterium]|nr:ammonia-dependent NAD(+) synthetase [Promicromonosporaceae bacterium]
MQSEIIRALGTAPEINASAEIERRVAFLADYLTAARARGYVLGISGGQDSTLAGRLAQLAVERVRESGGEVEFVAMPLPYLEQRDADDVERALEFIKPDRVITANIFAPVAGVERALADAFPEGLSDYNRGNVKARIRMVMQYTVAGELGLLVIGTDHAAEAVTGFYTKWGDGAADVTPLAGLTKGQGRELLANLAAPSSLIEKIPTADLLDDVPGRPDEDELGVTYQKIDDYLRGRWVSPDAVAKIEAKYQASAHKRHPPIGPADTWWRNEA